MFTVTGNVSAEYTLSVSNDRHLFHEWHKAIELCSCSCVSDCPRVVHFDQSWKLCIGYTIGVSVVVAANLTSIRTDSWHTRFIYSSPRSLGAKYKAYIAYPLPNIAREI